MAPNYKLTYLNQKGVAEPIRYMFAYKHVPYEDTRIEKDDWLALKEKQPFGTVPVFQVGGHVITGSLGIMRYVARELGLAGKNNFESAMADMAMDAIVVCVDEIRVFAIKEKDEDKKAQLKKQFFEVTVPACFNGLHQILKNNNGKFFVGDDLTWADFGVAHFVELIQGFDESILQDYPLLKTHMHFVLSIPEIKNWIAKRPKTDL